MTVPRGAAPRRPHAGALAKRQPWIRGAARLESRAGLDGAVGVVGAAVAAVAPRGRLGALLAGTWLGHPLHPLLVTATAGSWTGAVLMDVARREEPARTLTGAGVLFGLPTLVTGFADWNRVRDAPQPARVGLVHAAASTAAVGFFGASWAARRAGRTGTGRLLTAAGVAAVFVGDYLGGHLVYSQAVGLDRLADEPEELGAADATAGVAPSGVAAGGALDGGAAAAG